MNISNAMAFQDYDYEADRNQVSVSSLKCNNINVNINGLELDVFPSFLGSDLTADATEGSTDVISFADNSSDSSEINDFRFICINNNNNTVIGGEEAIPPVPPVDECAEDVEACFEEFLSPGDFETLTMALENGLTVPIEGLGQVTFNSFADICESLEGLTMFELRGAIGDILGALGILPPEDFTGFVDCIAEAIGITIS